MDKTLRYLPRRITLPLFVVTAALFSDAEGYQPMQTQVVPSVHYQDYLREVGDRLDCYFTVELYVAEDHPPSLPFQELAPKDVATVEELVGHLRKELKDVTVTLRKPKPTPKAKSSETRPVVIHLAEAQLAREPDYPLDRKFDLKFSGTVHELLVRLKERFGDIGPWPGGSIPMVFSIDFETRVSVDAKDQPIREILTEAVLRDGYNRILWEAQTEERENVRRRTDVRFIGPAWEENEK